MTFSKKHKAANTHTANAEGTGQSADQSPAQEAHGEDADMQASAGDTPPASGESTPPIQAPAPSEADQWKDRLLRLQADFDNYRKRMVRDREDTIARANAELLSELLTPIDHMDRAVATMLQSTGEDDPCVQGVRMVRTELLAVLERFGLTMLDVAGKPFDPALHEALGWAAAPGIEEGHIAVQVRAGYLLNGRVLRAAQVMLAGPAEPPPQEPAPAEEGTEG